MTDHTPRRELTLFWKFFAFFVGCVAMALVVGVLVVMLQNATTTQAIRDTQQTNTQLNSTNTQLLHTNTQLLRKVAHLSHRIQSCTTPGRPCQQRGRRQLAATVAGLTQGNQQAASAAAACATQVHSITYRTVLRCVRQATSPVPTRKR